MSTKTDSSMNPGERSSLFAYSTNSGGDGRISIRYLLRDPERGWIRFAKAKVEAVTNEQLVMPEYAGLTIDIACAYVEMLFSKPIRLVKVERDAWPVRSDGMYDKALVGQWIHYKLSDGADGTREPWKGGFDDDDKNAIRKALQIIL